MPRYMIQASYSTQGITELVKNPQDRSEAVRPAIERLGGSLESFDFCFGDYDVVAIFQVPDNVSALPWQWPWVPAVVLALSRPRY